MRACPKIILIVEFTLKQLVGMPAPGDHSVPIYSMESEARLTSSPLIVRRASRHAGRHYVISGAKILTYHDLPYCFMFSKRRNSSAFPPSLSMAPKLRHSPFQYMRQPSTLCAIFTSLSFVLCCQFANLVCISANIVRWPEESIKLLSS
jgi:hypothetical protein